MAVFLTAATQEWHCDLQPANCKLSRQQQGSWRSKCKTHAPLPLKVSFAQNPLYLVSSANLQTPLPQRCPSFQAPLYLHGLPWQHQLVRRCCTQSTAALRWRSYRVGGCTQVLLCRRVGVRRRGGRWQGPAGKQEAGMALLSLNYFCQHHQASWVRRVPTRCRPTRRGPLAGACPPGASF